MKSYDKRQWVTRQQYLDMLGLTNLIPGPNSTEMAINVGFARAGWAGLVVAGASFIAPAALITAAVAWAYVRFGTLAASGVAVGRSEAGSDRGDCDRRMATGKDRGSRCVARRARSTGAGCVFREAESAC